MFALSRWSGGLIDRVGSRIPLTIGPVVAGVGFAMLARVAAGGSIATTAVPGVTVLGLGMALTVAPLTTAVMSSVTSTHSGVASGVNNAVSRVAGLIAIAVFGVVVAHVFQGRVMTRLSRLPISVDARAALTHELPKMAGADLRSVPSLDAGLRARVREAIDDSFAAAYRTAMFGAAALALAAACIGFAVV
jgi:hypothetical protein